jgi:kinesin family protein 13
MSEKSSVQVAVRVRPINEREGSSDVITLIDKNVVYLTDPEYHKKKNFTFDYVYDQFSTQEQVFNDIGTKVIDNAYKGYNCCVFAYGQTGVGKSFTMSGSKEDLGLIPRICKALYDRQNSSFNTSLSIETIPSSSSIQYKVELSYLEIYSEEVRDLLSKGNDDLKVRQHPEYGTYVEGITQCIVEDYKSIKTLIDQGDKERITTATLMNARSSRSHAILTLYFTQIISDSLGKKEIISKINLVDLAGSERVSDSGVQGINFKEAVNINKSLTTLGIVISKLASNSNKTNRRLSKTNNEIDLEHIPFRDSVLTWILKESLGGNSKTFMIAGISPSSLNYSESLGTLRYANNAKQIVNNVSVNEDTNDKIVKVLKDEIESLRKQLSKLNSTADPEIIKKLKEEIQQREDLMKEREKTWEQKLNESKSLHDQLQALASQHIAEKQAEFMKQLTTNEEERKKLLNEIDELNNSKVDLETKHVEKQKELASRQYEFEKKKIVETAISLQEYYDNKLILLGTDYSDKLQIAKQELDVTYSDKLQIAKQDFELKIKELITTYEDKIAKINKENSANTESKIKELTTYIEKIKQSFVQERAVLARQIQQLQAQLTN